jgi:hypothetical protein
MSLVLVIIKRQSCLNEILKKDYISWDSKLQKGKKNRVHTVYILYRRRNLWLQKSK